MENILAENKKPEKVLEEKTIQKNNKRLVKWCFISCAVLGLTLSIVLPVTLINRNKHKWVAVPKEDLTFDDSNGEVKLTGLDESLTLDPKVNELLVPKEVTILGMSANWNVRGFWNLELYPQITRIAFEKGSVCKKIGDGFSNNNQMANIKEFDTSNIGVDYTVGNNCFMSTPKMEKIVFSNKYSGGGINTFSTNATIKDVRWSGGGKDLAIQADLISGNSNEQTSVLKTMRVDRNVSSIGRYFLCRMTKLNDVYLYGNAPDTANVDANWLGDGTDNWDWNTTTGNMGCLENVKFHMHKTNRDGWMAIFNDTTKTWNTSKTNAGADGKYLFSNNNFIID